MVIPFSVHPVIAYAESIVRNFPKTTGRSLPEWLALIEQQGLQDPAQIKRDLRENHGLGATKIKIVLDSLAGQKHGLDAEAYLKQAPIHVSEMYAGKKAHLLPIYEAIALKALQLGGDVRICPCKTMVPLYRNHVFAEIKPTTQKRVDLGLALKNEKGELDARLVPTGGLEKGDRITHRIPLATVEDLNAFVDHWLGRAYALDG